MLHTGFPGLKVRGYELGGTVKITSGFLPAGGVG